MAKIICVSKYPPLEGGISAKTYWLFNALAERGHTIHVITDRENISPEYTISSCCDELNHKNVIIHRPLNDIPWYLPNIPDRTSELLDLTLQVINDCGADVIDTGYLIPYGLVGYLASKISGVPFILRHGGSDIEKFLKKGIWNNLLKKAITEASVVITNSITQKDLKAFSDRVKTMPPYIPNPSLFSRKKNSSSTSKPVLAIIGKANYYWKHKGWHRVIEIIKCLGPKYQYLFVTQGVGVEEFKQYVEKEVDINIQWQDFVHPFEMPDILKSISGVFVFEQDLPFVAFSNLIIEAIYCGTTVITDRKDIIQNYTEQGLHLNFNSQEILVVPRNNPEVVAKIIIDHFEENDEEKKEKLYFKEDDFKAYISGNEEVFCRFN